jgi:hypothetical protein
LAQKDYTLEMKVCMLLAVYPSSPLVRSQTGHFQEQLYQFPDLPFVTRWWYRAVALIRLFWQMADMQVYSRADFSGPSRVQLALLLLWINLTLALAKLVHRVISRRHTAVGQLADFQGGPSRTGGYDEHI